MFVMLFQALCTSTWLQLLYLIRDLTDHEYKSYRGKNLWGTDYFDCLDLYTQLFWLVIGKGGNKEDSFPGGQDLMRGGKTLTNQQCVIW